MTQVIQRGDPRYPKLLGEVRDAPKQLYYKGSWNSNIFEKCLAVVGTRRMTGYGKKITEDLVAEIANAGITIVSGFMYGIDATAHKAAVSAGGRTIAVMPCGIEIIHPSSQEDLYQEILEHEGLIISEYEGKFLPTLWSYPRRNRIVAGLCQATLVVEAGEKSGSLITANFARSFGRKLFAVPGPITSSVSQGTLGLLQEGVELVKGAENILSFYGVSSGTRMAYLAQKSGQAAKAHSSVEQQILDHLQREHLDIDTLARLLGVSAGQLGTTLSLMQLNGLITEQAGLYYCK